MVDHALDGTPGASEMTEDRHAALMADDDLPLTSEKLAEGWHFCPDWDGLLVGPGMKETESCNCGDPGSVFLGVFKEVNGS